MNCSDESCSLRSEYKRLKKQAAGVLTTDEKETLERHILHLQQVHQTELARHEAARAQ